MQNNTMPIVDVELEIQELNIPFLPDRLKGKIFVAVPTPLKPGVDVNTWNSAFLNNKLIARSHLVIPWSFWPENKPPFPVSRGRDSLTNSLRSCIDFADMFCGLEDLRDDSPIESIEEIVNHLLNGEDLTMLSPTKEISGFLPAMLTYFLCDDIHILKVLWPIIKGNGYELSQFQIGYLYGMADSSKAVEFKSLGGR